MQDRVLTRAAVQHYEAKKKKTLLGCYSKNNPKKGYCFGRFSKIQFICLHIAIAILIITIILIPLFYALIIPTMIRDKIRDLDLSQAVIKRLHLENFHKDGFVSSAHITIPPQLPVPLSATIAPCSLKIYIHGKDDSAHQVMQLEVPKIGVSLHKDIVLDLEDVHSSWKGTDQDFLRQFLLKFSSSDGVEPFVLSVTAEVDIAVFGITFYKEFKIRKDIHVPKLDSNMLTLMKTIPPMLKQKTVNTEISKLHPMTDLIQISQELPFIKIHTIEFNATPQGIRITTIVSIENPMILSLDLKEFEFGLLVEEILVARIKLDHIQLRLGMNSNMRLSTLILFDDPRIDKSTLPSVMKKLQDKLLDKNTDYRVSISGPINIGESEKLLFATQHLALHLPIKELFDAFPLESFQELIKIDEVKKLIGKSELEMNVQPTAISIPYKIALPFALAIPSFKFPFYLNIGILSEAQHALEIMIDPIHVDVDANNIYISSQVTILPDNNEAAAIAMAEIVNPLLSRPPKTSKLIIGNIRVFEDTKQSRILKRDKDNSVLPWSTKLLSDVKIPMTIPAIFNIVDVINLVTASEQHLPFAINHLHVKQLSTHAGFAIDGDISVAYPPGIPKLSLLLGYIGMEIGIENEALLNVELPNGIKFTSQVERVPVDIAVIVPQRDLSSYVNKFLEGVDQGTSSVSLSGIAFGVSKLNHFLTFSKIIAELTVAELEGISKRAMDNKMFEKELLRVDGIKIDIVSGNRAEVAIKSMIDNPMNISAAINPVEMSLNVMDDVVVRLKTSRIELQNGFKAFELQLIIDVSSGTNRMSANIAQVVDEFLKDKSLGQVSICNFAITHLNSALSINQFKNVNVPADLLTELAAHQSSSNFVSMKNLIPDDDIISQLNTRITSIFANIQDSISFKAGLSFNNPLPIRFSLPELSLSVALEESNVVNIHIKHLKLVPGYNHISPEINMNFVDSSHNQIIVNDAYVLYRTKKFDMLDAKILGVHFGANGRINSILHKVSIDPLPYIEDVDTSSLSLDSLGIKVPHSFETLLHDFKPKLNSIDVRMIDTETLRLQVAASIHFKIPLDITVGGGSINLQTPATLLSRLSLSSLRIKSTSSIAHLQAIIDTKLNGNDESAQEWLSEKVNDFFSGNFDLNVNVNGLSIGNQMNVFSRINIPIEYKLKFDYNKMVDDVKKTFESSNHWTSSKVAIKSLGLEAISSKTLNSRVSAEMKIPVNVTCNLEHVSSQIMLNGRLLATVSLGINIATFETTRLDFSASIHVNDNQDAQVAVKDLLDQLVVRGSLSHHDIGLKSINFGKNSDNPIMLLSRISIKKDLEFLEIVYKEIDPMVNSFKGIVRDLITKFSQESDISFRFAQNDYELGLNSTSITFESDSSLQIKLDFFTRIPFDLYINMPYIGIQSFINDVPLAQIILSKIHIESPVQKFSLIVSLQLFEIQAIIDETKKIFDTITTKSLSYNSPVLSLSNTHFGRSSADSIALLSQFSPSISIYHLTQIFSFEDIKLLIKIIGLNLQRLDVSAAPDRSLHIQSTIGHILKHPAEFCLEHFSFDVMLDEANLLELVIHDVILLKSSSYIDIQMKVKFPSSVIIQDKLAGIVDQIMKNLSMSQLKSELHIQNFKFSTGDTLSNPLESLQIRLPIKKLYQPQLLKSALTLVNSSSVIIPDFKPTGVSFDASPLEFINFGATALALNIPYNIKLNNPFFNINILANETKLVGIEGTQIEANTMNQTISGSLKSQIRFEKSEGIRDIVNIVANDYLETELVFLKGSIGGFTFGLNAHDHIDSFSGIRISHDIQGLIVFAKEKLNLTSILSSITQDDTSPFTITKAHIGIPVHESFSLDLAASLNLELLKIIHLNVPFISINAAVDGIGFSRVTVENVLVKDGQVSTRVLIDLFKDIRVAQDLITYATNLMFRRNNHIFPTFQVHNVTFGSSDRHHFTLLNKVNILTNTEPTYDKVQMDYFKSCEESVLRIDNIDAVVRKNYINTRIEVQGVPAWLPVTTNLTIMAAIVYNKQEPTGNLNWTNNGVDIILSDILLTPGQPAYFNLVIRPKEGEPFLEAVDHAFARMFQFEDYAKHAMLGLATFIDAKTMSDNRNEWGNTVDVFNDAVFQAPPLWFWRPIVGNVSRGYVTELGRTYDITLNWPNPGPLNLNIGKIDGRMFDTKTNQTLLLLSTDGVVVIRSKANGGMDPTLINPIGFILRVTIPHAKLGIEDGFLNHIQHSITSHPTYLMARITTYLRTAKLVINSYHPEDGIVSFLESPLARLQNVIAKESVATIKAMSQNLKFYFREQNIMYYIYLYYTEDHSVWDKAKITSGHVYDIAKSILVKTGEAINHAGKGVYNWFSGSKNETFVDENVSEVKSKSIFYRIGKGAYDFVYGKKNETTVVEVDAREIANTRVNTTIVE